MKIAPMTIRHLPRVAKLTKQLGYTASKKVIEIRFQSVRKIKNRALFVAIISKDVVGWIDLDVIHTLLHEPRAEIRALVVDEKFRGQGIGKHLVTHAKHWAKSKKIKRVFLRTNIKRKDAHRFYEREKFVNTKTSYKYEIKL